MLFKAIVAAMSAALLTSPAVAQSMNGMDHSTHAESPMVNYMAPMKTMTEAMDGMASSGDADADFLRMMIPHHQSAIDMAQIELEQGDDEETRKLARKIINDQEREISQMKEALKRLNIETTE